MWIKLLIKYIVQGDQIKAKKDQKDYSNSITIKIILICTGY